jgi:transposase
MLLKSAVIALTLGTAAAHALDTTKLGQWGSLTLSDIMPLIEKTPKLQSEVKSALADSGKTADTLICIGARFPGAWVNLGGERVAPYTCEFKGKWLKINATVRLTGRRGRVFATVSPTAMRLATAVSLTNVTWEWSTTDPDKAN